MSTLGVCVAFLAVSAGPSADDAFIRTDPKTWSTDGAFGLKWGMGPGDVRRVYPDLAENRFFFSRSDWVEGMEVLAMFHFFQDRLVKVALAASTSTRLVTKRDFDEQQTREQEWVDRLRPILTEKYGTARKRSDADGTTWRWRKSRTGVLLTMSRAGNRLTYVDVELVELAEAAEAAAIERALKAAEAAERGRL